MFIQHTTFYNAILINQLTAQAKFSDDFAVTLKILGFDIAKETATLANQLQQTAARMEIFGMTLHMLS